MLNLQGFNVVCVLGMIALADPKDFQNTRNKFRKHCSMSRNKLVENMPTDFACDRI